LAEITNRDWAVGRLSRSDESDVRLRRLLLQAYTVVTTLRLEQPLLARSKSKKWPRSLKVKPWRSLLTVNKKLVIPLDEFTNSDAGKELLTEIDPALLKGFTVDGKLYLLPEAWNNMMIYYNTKVFKEAGVSRPADDWTWDDFLALAKRLTSGEGPSKRFGFPT
jgi:Bacterial extracellular solute-binding protein